MYKAMQTGTPRRSNRASCTHSKLDIHTTHTYTRVFVMARGYANILDEGVGPSGT